MPRVNAISGGKGQSLLLTEEQLMRLAYDHDENGMPKYDLIKRYRHYGLTTHRWHAALREGRRLRKENGQ